MLEFQRGLRLGLCGSLCGGHFHEKNQRREDMALKVFSVNQKCVCINRFARISCTKCLHNIYTTVFCNPAVTISLSAVSALLSPVLPPLFPYVEAYPAQ